MYVLYCCSGVLLYGGCELGGTSIKLTLSLDDPTNVIHQTSIITTKNPKHDLEQARLL